MYLDAAAAKKLLGALAKLSIIMPTRIPPMCDVKYPIFCRFLQRSLTLKAESRPIRRRASGKSGLRTLKRLSKYAGIIDTLNLKNGSI